jgi:hypothetical protein
MIFFSCTFPYENPDALFYRNDIHLITTAWTPDIQVGDRIHYTLLAKNMSTPNHFHRVLDVIQTNCACNVIQFVKRVVLFAKVRVICAVTRAAVTRFTPSLGYSLALHLFYL